MSDEPASAVYGQEVAWEPDRPRFRPLRLLLSWLLTGIALWFAALILPGVTVVNNFDALLMAAIVAILNALLPPIIAAVRLPYMIAVGFVLVLLLNAAVLLLGSNLIDHSYDVDNFGWALLAAFVVAAVSVVLEVIFGTNDDDAYTLRVIQRIARRQGGGQRTDVPGIIFLEIDGLALPVLQRAMRDGEAPNMANWLSRGRHRLTEWETDLSSQTGASQAGILLGSNDDMPAFRWVEKDTGRLMACSAPADCAEIERRHSSGDGLLANGGASRGNLLSGEAEEVILTVSRMDEEKKANPGYRAFFANGFNVTRALVLFGWEVILEWTAAARQRRRDVDPRGHRGGIYPFMRGAMCVIVRDLIVYGVLTDMMRGRPAVYATFSSYDEVAHHSGLERADTMEALRKLDQQFARIDRARRYAPRPYELVVLSDHGQTQGATFKQRNGYGLDELVERSLEAGDVWRLRAGTSRTRWSGTPSARPPAGAEEAQPERRLRARGGRARLGQPRADLSHGGAAPPDARGAERAPPAADPRPARATPHIGWLLVRSTEHGPLALGAGGVRYLADGRVEGEDPLAHFSPTAPQHLLRTDGFGTWPTSWSAASTTPQSSEGCAFEELISFHGGLGGPRRGRSSCPRRAAAR